MLSKKLKNLRMNSNITQEELALRLGISRVRYNNYETGKRLPDYAILKRIADHYDVSIDYLLDRSDCMGLENKINLKIEAFNEIAKLYEGLVKKHSKYMYRLNAIEAILETLHELQEGIVDANAWMECYREDAEE